MGGDHACKFMSLRKSPYCKKYDNLDIDDVISAGMFAPFNYLAN